MNEENYKTLMKYLDFIEVEFNKIAKAHGFLSFEEWQKEKEMSKEIARAMTTLCRALREDEEYYLVWQANIAVAFQDEMANSKDETIHKKSNNAAKNFLEMLMYEERAEIL